MKTNQFLKLSKTPVVVSALAVAIGIFSQPSIAAIDQGVAISSSELTQNGYTYPSDLVSNASQTQLANYAWRLFIASTQESNANLMSGQGRGTPLSNMNFIDSGSKPGKNNALVFESFYHRTEAFPFYTQNKPMSPINELPIYYTYYDVGNTKKPLTINGQNYVYLDETNQISQNFLYYQLSHASDFPVLYMAKVNETEAAYALDSTRQKPSTDNSWDFPDGVIEVKSAWRRVKDIKNSDPSKYHQATATYYVAGSNGTPVLHNDTFALIAIHIIQKTANYPEFIFTTFEHVDATTRGTDNAILDPAYKTEYNKLVYETPSTNPHSATVFGAYDVNLSGQGEKSNITTTYTLPNAGPISQKYTTAVQPRTIIKEVNDVNNYVNNLISNMSPNNIWANYRLKGVQAVPTSITTTPNYFLANIAVETSQPGVQLFNGVLLNGGVQQNGYLVNCREKTQTNKCLYPAGSGVTNPKPPVTTFNNVSVNIQQGKPVPPPTFNMGGCQGCHGAAQQLGRDFSFLANGALGVGKELDTVPASALPMNLKAEHNSRMSGSSNYDLR